MIADVVDAALEASVVGSFTRLGFAVRRRLDAWTPLDGLDRAGRVVVITGGTSGLGLYTAEALARMGATVELVARDATKAESVCAGLRERTGNAAIGYVLADVGCLADVRRASAELLAKHPRIDVLIHNAGALDATYGVTAEGIEQTVAAHVVGPFLLTGLLLPALTPGPSGPPRVLWVTSGGMYSEPLSLERVEMKPDRYDGTVAYARAKRAQVTLAAMWAARLPGVIVQTMHPGWADTPGVARSLPTFRRVVGRALRSPAEGADTLVWLAVDDGPPLASTGELWLDRRPRALHWTAKTRASDTPAAREALWAWAVARSGWSGS